jgi:hypothetical protein
VGELDGRQVDLGEVVYLGSRVVDTLEDQPEPV